MGMCRLFAIERQGLIGIHHALALVHSAGSHFIDPDRMQNAHQPTVHARARFKLPAAFERPHAGGLHEVLGDMPLSGQQQAVTPQTRQVLSQFCPNVLIAGDSDLPPIGLSGFR
ncbi:hypothetical protein D3C76_1363430 [compost metagenome]